MKRTETRVLLADDQPQVRSALRLVLEQDGGMQVVGEVTNAIDLLEHIMPECADLLLLDWELPGRRASELVAELHACCPALVVIALSSRPQARAAALKAGAAEFVSKGDPPERLLAALAGCRHNGHQAGGQA